MKNSAGASTRFLTYLSLQVKNQLFSLTTVAPGAGRFGVNWAPLLVVLLFARRAGAGSLARHLRQTGETPQRGYFRFCDAEPYFAGWAPRKTLLPHRVCFYSSAKPDSTEITTMLLRINPDNPQEAKINQAVKILQDDGVIIYPTDTVYALGCHIKSKKAIERIGRIKQVDVKKRNFAMVCRDLKALGEYASQVDTPSYKVMKRALPGPYTFILKASGNVPRHFQSKKKDVGIRVIDHNVPTMLVERLESPILTTSLKHEDDVLEYRTDPELIYEKYGKVVDAVIDSGYGGNEGSTVVDLSDGYQQMEILREGKGPTDLLA